jgi:hypothetical protein
MLLLILIFYPSQNEKTSNASLFSQNSPLSHVSVYQARIRERTDTKECKNTEGEKQIPDQIIHTKGD